MAAHARLEQATRKLAFLRSDLLPALTPKEGSTADEVDARAREARAELVGLERAVTELLDLAEDLDDPAVRSTLLAQVDILKTDVAAARRDYRRSLMESAQTLDLAGSQRAALIPNATQAASDDPLQEKADQVTIALRKTNELMRAELESSVMASQLLDESTQTITSTNALYEKYSSLLDQSSALISALERTNYWDRICLLGGLAFFLGACAWILKRRVVDKAVGGLVSVAFGAGRVVGFGSRSKATGKAAAAVVDVNSAQPEASGPLLVRLAKDLEDVLAAGEAGGTGLTDPLQEIQTSEPIGSVTDGEEGGRRRDEL